MGKEQVICLHELDNVITALDFIPKGTLLPKQNLTTLEDISFGHKIALYQIEMGEKVFKYGTPIGEAIQTIPKGAHVHLHNLKSLQGKGETIEGLQEVGWKNRNT
jgi:hypothetical protein